MTLKQLSEQLAADRHKKPVPPTHRKFWAGTDPAEQSCACCGRHLNGVSVFIDGSIPALGGMWGLMCQACWTQHGIKIDGRATLGTGRGQKYRLEVFNGLVRWWKVESKDELARRLRLDAEISASAEASAP